jgi:hypothetical protein
MADSGRRKGYRPGRWARDVVMLVSAVRGLRRVSRVLEDGGDVLVVGDGWSQPRVCLP